MIVAAVGVSLENGIAVGIVVGVEVGVGRGGPGAGAGRGVVSTRMVYTTAKAISDITFAEINRLSIV